MLRDHPVLDPAILHGLHLIEADAGTGKTWTLSGLVIRALVERALDIDGILVVTFTRAATAELTGRIRARIEQLRRALADGASGDDPFIAAYMAQIDDPADALARTRRALACMDDAAVHTIHGFCQRVLTEHAMSTGAPLQTTLTARDDELLARVIGDWWRAQVVSGPVELVRFCTVHRLSPAALLPIVRTAMQTPDLELRPRVVDWRTRLDWPRAPLERLTALWAHERAPMRAWLLDRANVNGVSFRPASVERWFDEIDAWLGAARGLDDQCPEAAWKLSRAHFEVRNKNRQPPGPLADAFDDVVLAYRGRDACVAALIAEVLAHVRCTLPAARDAAGVLEFEDLLLRMREALADPEHGTRFAEMLQARYPLILIDECQDTDPLQWEVFRRIHFGGPASASGSGSGSGSGSASGSATASPGGHGLIVVGDPKQSIYGFRGADVFAYLDARDQGGRRHRLTENQRSDGPLIEGLNALFRRDDPFLIEQIEFSRATAADRRRGAFEDPHGSGRGPMTMVAIRGADAGADGGAGPKARPLTVERAGAVAACACAGEIARLLGPSGARLEGRPLRPSDIAVLVHRHTEGAAIKRELAALGIGAVELSRDSVFRSRQADELLRLIGALAQPARVELLRGALATRLLGWRAADLLGDAVGDERLAGAARVFAVARAQWFEVGPMAALRALLHHWGGFARRAGEQDGERVLTNVLHLLELLAAAPEARVGPQAAQRWLARRIESEGADEAAELRLESDARLVNVVTIHRSKGLEYPVVLMPFEWTARRHRRRGKPDQGILWHERGQNGWRAVRTFAGTEGSAAEEAEASAAREHHAEALRQFYVGVTRARHRCYVFWGAASGSGRAPLAWLLHGVDPLDDKAVRAFGPDQVMTTLATLAAGTPGAFGVLDASALASAIDTARERAGPGAGTGAGTATLTARMFTRDVPPAWQRRSFSSLLSSVRTEGDGAEHERPDHDEEVARAAQPTSATDAVADATTTTAMTVPTGVDEIDIDTVAQARFGFPAGPEAGNCLHAILEHTEFSVGVDTERVRDALLRSGFVDVDPASVARWLDEVLATPLRGPQGECLVLSSLPRSDTVRELAFELRARDADARRIAAAVARHYPLPFAPESIGGARWSGYLRGFVDLVFRSGGRYYIADWKSNLLGACFDDYGPEALAHAMRAHAYALQFSLYALALHRHLAARVPDYRYDTHFGGVFYLFLRGVRPGTAAPAGGQTGVHVARPALELIRALDALLPGPDEAPAQVPAQVPAP